MTAALDHLVVAAATLEQGVAWCEATLGVAPGPGGRHALFGTHNRLMRVATPAFPDLYLEIISIDPAAPAPLRARWFGLDDRALQDRLAAAPQLVHAVVRTDALAAHRARFVAFGLQPGEPVPASRETPAGTLRWEILVRDDGGLALGGALPTLIEWHGRHPAQAMRPSGVSLRSLTLGGPDPRLLARACEAIALPGVAVLGAPGPALRAEFDTPLGRVTLESPGTP